MGVVIHIGTREVLVPDPEPLPNSSRDEVEVWMEKFIDDQALNVQYLIEELVDCYENPAYGRRLISDIKKVVARWPG